MAGMAKSKPEWQLIGDYPVTEYKCGARAGEQVRLRRDLVVRDHKGKPTGEVHREGELWTVLNGCAVPPFDVWLRQPDGHDDNFWNWFERVSV